MNYITRVRPFLFRGLQYSIELPKRYQSSSEGLKSHSSYIKDRLQKGLQDIGIEKYVKTNTGKRVAIQNEYTDYKDVIPSLRNYIFNLADDDVISLMNLETAPNYAGSFPIVVDHSDGPWWVTKDGAHYLNSNASYQAKRLTNSNGHVSDLFSRAVYSRNQLLATYVANTYAHHAGIVNPKSLILSTGSEVMKAAFDGLEKYFDYHCKHIININHFHGRAEFNSWDYDSKYLSRRNIESVPFNDSDVLNEKVDQLIRDDSSLGIPIYIEPTQGEGGVNVISDDFANMIMQLKQKYPKNIVIVIDNVQRGFAGLDLWGVKNIKPDIMTLSKSVNYGNFPVGILLGNDQYINKAFSAGSHGGTHSLREDACRSIIDAFHHFISTNDLLLLQTQSDDIIQFLSTIKNKDGLEVKSDNNAMIGLSFPDNLTAKYYYKKAFAIGSVISDDKELKNRLINRFLDDRPENEKSYIKNEIDQIDISGMPMKIAGDDRTLRFSPQDFNTRDLVIVKLMLYFLLYNSK